MAEELTKNQYIVTLRTDDEVQEYFNFWSQQLDKIISFERKKLIFSTIQNYAVGVIISLMVILLILFLIGKLGNLSLHNILTKDVLNIFTSPGQQIPKTEAKTTYPLSIEQHHHPGQPAGGSGQPKGLSKPANPGVGGGEVPGGGGGVPGVGSVDTPSEFILWKYLKNLKVYQFLILPLLLSLVLSYYNTKLRIEGLLILLESRKEMVDAEKQIGLTQIAKTGTYKPFTYFPMPDLEKIYLNKQVLNFSEISISFTAMLQILGSVASIIGLIFVIGTK